MNIIHNHVGYNLSSPKKVVVTYAYREEFELGATQKISLIDSVSRQTVYEGTFSSEGKVSGWTGYYMRTIDFSDFQQKGTFLFCVGDVFGSPFLIDDALFFGELISDIIFYFKSQRCSGRWDIKDRALPFYGEREGVIDVHGGWFDASGDYSKYLSHLSYAHYLNPQQIPLTCWVLFEVGDKLEHHPIYQQSLMMERSFDEGWFGVDFLMRMLDDEGYFYTTVFDLWSKKSEERMICAFKTQQGHRLTSYKASFRSGGGMAIAALAKASQYQRPDIPEDGFSPKECRNSAIKAYNHLVEHNRKYLENGKENIIDYYCALCATVELYKTTESFYYLTESRKWARMIINLYQKEYGCFMVESGLMRPYYHASDSALPKIALLMYTEIESDENLVLWYEQNIVTIFEQEIERYISVYNPFGLSMHVSQKSDMSITPSFFIPHANESGYWWQGENAHLASEATAALMVMQKHVVKDNQQLARKLTEFAQSQIDWIFGCNPFDQCMMQGHGRNNPRYLIHHNNVPGGICNGITSGFSDEQDIAFLPPEAKDLLEHRWRWSEQWICHASWMIIALAQLLYSCKDEDCN